MVMILLLLSNEAVSSKQTGADSADNLLYLVIITYTT